LRAADGSYSRRVLGRPLVRRKQESGRLGPGGLWNLGAPSPVRRHQTTPLARGPLVTLPAVDVCIVGSGAGGAPMALELGRAVLKVVVLEKGPHYQKEEFAHDEILNSRRNFFMPLPWDEPHLIRQGASGSYERSNAAWTANCVGGGTVHMSGYFY